MSTEGAEEPKDGQLEFSGSVERSFGKLQNVAQFTASELARELKDLHPEYAGDRFGQSDLAVTGGESHSEESWRSLIRETFENGASRGEPIAIISGELLLYGLALRDPTLKESLETSGAYDNLHSSIKFNPGSTLPTSQPPSSSAATDPDRPGLDMLADRPLTGDDGDLLGFTEYADALAELIDNPETVTPLTIAISAPWGAGKTSLGNLVANRLREWPEKRGETPHIVNWFNAWMHEDAPHLGAAFAAEVAKSAERWRSPIRRLLSPLPSAMLSPTERARRQRRILAGSLLIAILVFWALSARGLSDWVDQGIEVPEGLGIVGVVTAGLFTVTNLLRTVFAAAKSVAVYVDEPRSAAASGSMDQVARQLGQLIGQATRPRTGGRNPRLVIFVDDVERCSPPRSVEVCEVANQLLNHPGVVTVLLADMPAIAAAAEIKYEKLSERYHARSGLPARESRSGAFGRLFLQKVVQFQFDLPSPRPEDMSKLTANLMQDNAEEGEDFDGDGQARDVLTTFRSRIFSEESGNAAESWLVRLNRQSLAMGRQMTSWPGVAVIVVASSGFLVIGVSNLGESDLLAYFFFALGAIYLLTAVAVGFRLVQLRRRRTQQERLNAAARSARTAGLEDVELLAAVQQEAVAIGADAELARQAHRRFIVTDSMLKEQAEKVIVNYLPPLPRSAKRMLNRLRFLLVVAWEREMFGASSTFGAAHLGKWVVLTERWPELAWAISATPSLLALAEDASDLKELTETLDTNGVQIPATQDLVDFLDDAPPLGPVATQLVYFEPA